MEATKTSCLSVWEVDSCWPVDCACHRSKKKHVIETVQFMLSCACDFSMFAQGLSETLVGWQVFSGKSFLRSHCEWWGGRTACTVMSRNKPWDLPMKEKRRQKTFLLTTQSMFFPHILRFICYQIISLHPIPTHPIPSSHPTCRQVRRRVDLDLKAHDAFLVGREKNCDVILEGLEMLGFCVSCLVSSFGFSLKDWGFFLYQFFCVLNFGRFWCRWAVGIGGFWTKMDGKSAENVRNLTSLALKWQSFRT